MNLPLCDRYAVLILMRGCKRIIPEKAGKAA